jgi:hypothetical protein
MYFFVVESLFKKKLLFVLLIELHDCGDGIAESAVKMSYGANLDRVVALFHYM